MEILNTTLMGSAKDVIDNCPTEDRIASLSILKHAEFVQVYIGGVDFDEDQSQIFLSVKVRNIC